MKMAVGFIASWALFWIGYVVSRMCMTRHWYVPGSYPVYNRLMLASIDCQDWGGHGPWSQYDGD